MDISPKSLSKLKRKKAMLFGFNIPMMIGVPCWIEFGNFAEVCAEKADKVLNLLVLGDFIIVLHSFMLYSVV